MKISIVVAVADNGVIGYKGQLLWHLPADLKHFKLLTLGKTVLMGRKTFESIGKPLPQRQNWVVSRQQNYVLPEGVRGFLSLEEALAQAKTENLDELCVIGGATLYQQVLPKADCIYLTQVKASPEGDTFFPPLSETEWTAVEKKLHQKDEKNEHSFEIIQLIRR